MELEDGYKRTEIGIFPADWGIVKFKEITKVITCGLAATPTYVNESVGKPFLSAQNVRDGKVVYDKYKFISKELYNLITKHNHPEIGDLLYTRVGAGIGEAGVIETNLRFGIYVSLTLIKVKSEKLYNYYLLQQLNSHKFKYLAKNGQFAGGGVQNLNVQVVREFLIPLPPLPEQQAIAEVLSDTDNLIQALEKQIAKKRLIKQGVMQKLLTPKEGWVVKKLGDVCEIHKGQLITEETRITGNIPVIAGGKTPAYYHNKANRLGKTITISCSGASAGYVSFHNYPIFASDCSTIEENENFSIEYVFYNMQLYQNSIYKMQTGGAQPHIHPSDLNPIPFPFPKKKEQISIASIISDMDSEIEVLEKKLSKYKSLKQGLMQNLLTGKIRLSHGNF